MAVKSKRGGLVVNVTSFTILVRCLHMLPIQKSVGVAESPNVKVKLVIFT